MQLPEEEREGDVGLLWRWDGSRSCSVLECHDLNWGIHSVFSKFDNYLRVGSQNSRSQVNKTKPRMSVSVSPTQNTGASRPIRGRIDQYGLITYSV